MGNNFELLKFKTSKHERLQRKMFPGKLNLYRKKHNDLVIIAQTAYALDGDKEKVLAAGCNEYITKPINKETLIQVLGNHF